MEFGQSEIRCDVPRVNSVLFILGKYQNAARHWHKELAFDVTNIFQTRFFYKVCTFILLAIWGYFDNSLKRFFMTNDDPPTKFYSQSFET